MVLNSKSSLAVLLSSDAMLQHQIIDYHCPTFVGFGAMPGSGNGHQFATFLFGLQLAITLNVTFVYKAELIRSTSSIHGPHSWMIRALNLLDGEHEYDEVMRQFKPEIVRLNDYDNTLNLTTRCNALYWVAVDSKFCGQKYCTREPRLSYEHVKNIMRVKFLKSAYVPKRMLVYHTHEYNVAWHVRIGDIKLHFGDEGFFTKIFSQIQVALRELKVPVHHYVFSEGHISTSFHFFHKFGNVTFIESMDAEDTFYHWVNADMVVETGSSFPTIAHAVAQKPVFIFTCPKEAVPTAYFVSEMVPFSCESNELTMPVEEFIMYVVDKFMLFHDWHWPRGTSNE